MFIDTHAHIYSEQLLTDKNEFLKRALISKVTTIIMPAIDSQTHSAMLAMEAQAPVTCLAMMGLHPCSVNAGFEQEMGIIKNFLDQRAFIAIGETGLDFYWDLTFKEQQYLAFEQQIEWAIEYNIPIVIHSRNATRECIDLVSKHISRGLKGVFHCFGGTVEEAAAIADMGFYMGIGGVLTFKKSGLDGVIKKVGLDKVVLETDAPYLAPVPYRGKRNEPSYIPVIAHKLAEVMELPVEDVAAITTTNAKKLFGL
ncbi:MAG: TatD family hydrolase [Niabella sp.]